MFSVLYLGNIIVKHGLHSVWAILTLCPWCCSSHGQYLKLDFPSAHSSFQWPMHVAVFYYLPWVSIAVSTWFFMTSLHCLIKSWFQQHGPALCCLITQQSLKYWNYKSCLILLLLVHTMFSKGIYYMIMKIS